MNITIQTECIKYYWTASSWKTKYCIKIKKNTLKIFFENGHNVLIRFDGGF